MAFIFKSVFSRSLSKSESCFAVWADISNSLAYLGNFAFNNNLHHLKKIYAIANNSHDLDNGIPYGLDHTI